MHRSAVALAALAIVASCGGAAALTGATGTTTVTAFASIIGTYTGTYSWSCNGAVVGSAAVTLEIPDQAVSSVYAAKITYLGPTDNVTVERYASAELNALGTYTYGARSGNGPIVVVTTQNHVVHKNNEFTLNVVNGGKQLVGTALNGENTPPPGGCGAGPRGTVTLSR